MLGAHELELQPLHIQKAVQTYSLKHENKPKSPLSERPQILGGVMFGLQQRAMSLPYSPVQEEDDKNIIYSKTPEDDKPGNSDERRKFSLLQLCPLCTEAGFDPTLGQLAQQLEDSIENQTL